MTDETPAPPAPAPGVPPQGPPSAPPEHDVSSLPDWARAALDKANKEAAGYRTKLREVEPLAKKAQELEEAQKTEAQKLSDAKAAAERTAAEATQNYLRLKVATSKGIPDLADRLNGATEEEMITDADRLVAVIGTRSPAPPPRGSGDGGARNGSPPPDTSARGLITSGLEAAAAERSRR